jgi:hypothetical protein
VGPLGVVPVNPLSNRNSSFGEVAEVVLPDTFLLEEFITPYTLEQNGIVERFFRSLRGRAKEAERALEEA